MTAAAGSRALVERNFRWGPVGVRQNLNRLFKAADDARTRIPDSEYATLNARPNIAGKVILFYDGQDSTDATT